MEVKQRENIKIFRLQWMCIVTFLMFVVIVLFQERPVYASTIYNINTTNIEMLQSNLIGVATVSGSAISVGEEIITITLKDDVNGTMIFEGQDQTTFILDAAGHTIDGAGHKGVIQLSYSNEAQLILRGSGIYQPGTDYTIYDNGSKNIIVETGIFKAPDNGSINRSDFVFKLAEGYDYYTVTDYNRNIFKSHNRIERSSIPSDLEQLIVEQHYGEVPSYNIEALATENGYFTVMVNGVPATSAKVDDTITVTSFPNPNYILKSMISKEPNEEELIYYGIINPWDLTMVFDMSDHDLSIEVTFNWKNQIITQPTPDNPTVVTNNPGRVSSYQWYTSYIKDYLLVRGTAGEGEANYAEVFAGDYDSSTKRWSSNWFSYIHISNYHPAEKIIISEVIGEIRYIDATLQPDGSYIADPYSIRIEFTEAGGSCKITLQSREEVVIEGQTSETYSGPRGEVYTKVKFSDNEILVSDIIAYEELYTVTVNQGLGDGKYAAGKTVSITADPAEVGKQFKEWVVEKGVVTIASSTSESTTFIMPSGEVVVTAIYEEYIPVEYAVTVNKGLGDGNYMAGVIVTITADPAEVGKQFKEWVVEKGGVTLISNISESTTFIMPSEDVEVTATYKDITVTEPWTPILPTPVEEGKVEKDYQQAEGTPVVNINNCIDELKTSVLNARDLEMLSKGENAKIMLEVKDISNTIKDEEKKLILDQLLSEKGNSENEAMNITVLYVDLSLYKKIGNQERTKITETTDKISISIQVPRELWNTDVRKSRDFYILRNHNGVVSRIDGSYDEEKKLFTFETDSFSTYALTYEDIIEIHNKKNFRHLRLKAKGGETSQTLSFKRIYNADGYLIYGGKCGQDMTLLAELPAHIISYTDMNLQKGTHYKYQVMAYRMIDEERVIIMTSKVVHSTTEDSKYGNSTKIITDMTSVKLEEGESITLTVSLKLPANKKLREHTAAIRYESSNKEIATINSNGKLNAKSKGSCYIYIYAQNGVYKKLKVTVN